MVDEDYSHIGQLIDMNGVIVPNALGNPALNKEAFDRACDNYIAESGKPMVQAMLDLVEAASKDLRHEIDEWESDLEGRVSS